MPSLQVGKKLPTSDDFFELQRCRKFWRGSYEAGHKYRFLTDCNGEPVLWRYNGEDNEAYARRQVRVTVQPHVRTIVDKYIGFMFRSAPTRAQEPDWYTDFNKNVDGQGTSIDELLESMAHTGIVELESFVYVTSSENAEQVSGADDVEPRALVIPPCNVPWCSKSHGRVHQAIILVTIQDQLFGLWIDDTIIQIIHLKETMDKQWYIVEGFGEEIQHNMGRAPLLHLNPRVKMVPDIAESTREIYNQSSLLNQNLYNTTFNQFAITGIDPGQPYGADEQGSEPAETGTEREIMLPAGADMKWVGPPPTTISVIREVIRDHRKFINESAGIGSLEVNQAESGLAKAFKFDELNVRMVRLIGDIEKLENDLLVLAARAIGVPDDVEPVQWPNDVSVPDLVQEFERTDKIASSGNIPNVIKKREMMNLAALYDLSTEQREQLQAQLDKLYPDEDVEPQQVSEPVSEPEPGQEETLTLTPSDGPDNVMHSHTVTIQGSGEYTSSVASGHTHEVIVSDDETVTIRPGQDGHTHGIE